MPHRLILGEYEDATDMGTYPTEDAAAAALGRYVLAESAARRKIHDLAFVEEIAETAIPAEPTACQSCGTGYDECTVSVRDSARACCATCGYRVTHAQNAWERAHRSRTIAEVRAAGVTR